MNMKIQLKLEELAQFLMCVFFLVHNEVAWWVYFILFLGPDIGMLGYLISSRVGAATYNVLHHKGIAFGVLGIGLYQETRHVLEIFLGLEYQAIGYQLIIMGIVLYGHASMDRIFGYGLKYATGFQHTHLDLIGRPGNGLSGPVV